MPGLSSREILSMCAADLDLDRRRLLQSIACSVAALPTVSSLPLLAQRQRLEAEEAGGVLSSRQLAIVAEASERVLPRTDTAGAKETGVPAFIDRMLDGWLPPGAREVFVTGVDDLEARSQKQQGRSFLELGDDERDSLLTVLEREALTARGGQPWTLRPDVVEPGELAGLEFFDLLRWLVFVGYYTSEAGMTQELGYRVVPGPYVGCDDGEA